MKIYKKFKHIALLSVVLILTLLLCMVLSVTADVSNDDVVSLDVRVVDDHPGVPGFNTEYTFLVYGNTKYNTSLLDTSKYTLSCNNANIVIEDNKVTIPASYKDNTDIQVAKIYATLKENTEIRSEYPLMIKNWEITLQDDFNGTELNSDVWRLCKSWKMGDIGGGKTVAASSEAYEVKDGKLVLRLIDANGGTTETKNGVIVSPDYFNAAVETKNLFTQHYGLFEASIKMPDTGSGGANTAFWLLPSAGDWGKTFFAHQRSGTLKGYYCGEIDIVEYSPQWGKKYQATDHWWSGVSTGHTDNGKRFQYDKIGSDYVSFAAAWTPNGIYYYCDGKLVKSVKSIDTCEDDAYMLFTMGSAGYGQENATWAGWFDDSLLDTLVSYVDYVKIYK